MFTVSAAAQPEPFPVDVIFVKLGAGLEVQMIAGAATLPGEMILARRISDCSELTDPKCFEPLKVVPLRAKNFRLGVRVGASITAGESVLTLYNWNKTNLVKLFGTYRGVSALSVEFATFIGSLNLKASDAALINRSGVVALQGPRASWNKMGTPSMELASYRSLELIPLHQNREMRPEEIPNIQLFNAKDEPAKQPPSPITARTAPPPAASSSEPAVEVTPIPQGRVETETIPSF